MYDFKIKKIYIVSKDLIFNQKIGNIAKKLGMVGYHNANIKDWKSDKWSIIILDEACLEEALLKNIHKPIILVLRDFSESNYTNALMKHGVYKILPYDSLEAVFEKVIISALNDTQNSKKELALTQAIEHSKNSVVITDLEGKVKFANRYFLELTKYDLSEILDIKTNFLKTNYHPVDYYKVLWDTIKRGQVWEGFFCNKKKDGTLVYEYAVISPIFEDDKIINYIKISYDVTKAHLMQEHTRKELVFARTMLKSFLPESINNSKYKFDYFFEPFSDLGGDLVYFHEDTIGDRIKFAIIDINGHEISSALFGIHILGILNEHFKKYNFEKAIRLLSTDIENINNKKESVERYATGVFCELDLASDTLKYCSFGHPDFLIKNHNNRVVSCEANNTLLGYADSANLSFRSLQINSYTYEIILYTDGLIENKDQGYLHQINKLKNLIGNKNRFVDLENIVKHMVTFDSVKDDITLMRLLIKK